MKKLQIGAQLFTVRDFMQTPEAVRETFRKIRETGFDTVQVSGIGPIQPEQLRDYAQENQLHICLTHIPYERLDQDLDRVIAEHKVYGCEIIGLGAMPSEFRGSQEGFEQFILWAKRVTQKVREAGLDFSYHHHRFEFERFANGRLGIDMLIEEVPEMLLTLDTYWVQAGGANPVDYIQKTAGRVHVLHLKDMRIVQDEQQFAEIGEGNIDFSAVFAAAEKCGTRIAVIEQDQCYGRSPFDSLQHSLRYIQHSYLNI